ncbi:MAG: hypothetical protein FJ144_26165 [Deltaproteobacteria bacterium]|nr:hypothetical protein [Deltaproteobacteria bacterium]
MDRRSWRSLGLLVCALFAARAEAHGPSDLAEPKETTEQSTASEADEDESAARRRWQGVEEVIVTARKQPLTAASSKEINMRDYLLRPHSTTQEIMNNVPGLLVVQHQGGGKAFQYFLRGFDIDHGTDFLLTVDGMPVNLVSHAHGQGYADSNFLIPETVEGLRLFKGPYFAEFGDMAVAGVLGFQTFDEFPENFVLAQGGSFDTARSVIGVSRDLGWGKVLVSGEGYYTNAWFDDPEDFWQAKGLVKLTMEPAPDHKVTASGQVYFADWDASGQIPLRAVQEDQIGRFGTLDPTEGGRTDRELINLQYWYTPSETNRLYTQVWGQHYSLDLWSNFTFFRETGLRFLQPAGGGFVDTCAGWTPKNPVCAPIDPNATYDPGDGIEQRDERITVGGQSIYSHDGEMGSLPYESQFGVFLRGDFPYLALDRQIQRKVFFNVNQVKVHEWSTGGFAQAEFFPAEWIRFQLGLRGDVFFYDVDNRLPGYQAPDRNFEPVFIAGSQTDGIVSPKLNVIVTPFEDDTELYFNAGSGFHSNDARGVVLTGQDGVVRATGGETGIRGSWIEGLDLAAALWILDLNEELVFSGDGGDVDADVDLATGNFIPGGATRRWGLDFYGRYDFADWLYVDYDLAWADPKFTNGDAIPLAPKLYMNGGLTFEYEGFGAAFRVRNLADRPATEDESITAPGWTLFDILFRYRWRNIEASVAFLNVMNVDWNESQFAEATCLRGEEATGQPCPDGGSLPLQDFAAEGIDDLTFSAGHPFEVRGGIQVFF